MPMSMHTCYMHVCPTSLPPCASAHAMAVTSPRFPPPYLVFAPMVSPPFPRRLDFYPSPSQRVSSFLLGNGWFLGLHECMMNPKVKQTCWQGSRSSTLESLEMSRPLKYPPGSNSYTIYRLFES